MGQRERSICACGHDREVHAYRGVYGPCRECACDQFTAGGFLALTDFVDRPAAFRLNRVVLWGVAIFLLLVVALAIVVTLP